MGWWPWCCCTAECFCFLTGSYSTKYLETLESAPYGFCWNPDGTRAFLVGYTNDTVYELSCSTPYRIGTASSTGNTLSVSGQDTQPRDVAISSDGSKLFVLGNSNKAIFQYSLPSAGTLGGSPSYDSVSLDLSSEVSDPQGIGFGNSGTRVYVVDGSSSDTIFQYNNSTGWDLSTGSYASKSLDVSSESTNPQDIYFCDKDTFFLLDADNVAVWKYARSSGSDWDITGMAPQDYNPTMNLAPHMTNPVAFDFEPDGAYINILSHTDDYVFEFSVICECDYEASDGTEYTDTFSSSLDTNWIAGGGTFFSDWSISGGRLRVTKTTGIDLAPYLYRVYGSFTWPPTADSVFAIIEADIYKLGSDTIRTGIFIANTAFFSARWDEGDYWAAQSLPIPITPQDGDTISMILTEGTSLNLAFRVCFAVNGVGVAVYDVATGWSPPANFQHGVEGELRAGSPSATSCGEWDNYTSEVNL